MKIENFIIKIASRCNLNCSYCYMYNLGDKTYKNQPKKMTIETTEEVASSIRTYCDKSNTNNITIVFHGGEPLLVGVNYFKAILACFKEHLSNLNYHFAIQTNGVLLDEEWLSFFELNNIYVGISIDGVEEQHDRYRLDHKGMGSYKNVIRSIRKAQKYSIFGGVLYVVNPEYSAEEIYNNFKMEKIHALNILLPDYHYSSYPYIESNSTIFGNWMIDLYEVWKNDTNNRISIIFFQNIINNLLNSKKKIGSHLMGNNYNPVICIETNGDIEVLDSLRSCEEGITRGNLNVKNSYLEDIYENQLFRLYYNSHYDLSNECLKCEVKRTCGGGFLPHRYSKKNKFDNPSIYCDDLKKLIQYISYDLSIKI